MRAVDLARSAGISVQQVRNYVELGILPPVERAANGYRVYTDDHAAALSAARRIAAGHGWKHARTIMRAVHDGDLETALATLDRSHAELDRERSDIDRVLGAFDMVASDPPKPARPRRKVRVGEVAEAVGVRASSLRLWEQRGLLRPGRDGGTGHRVYDEPELRKARVVALLRRGGYPFPTVRAVLEEMDATGSPERVRAELGARGKDLHQRSLRRLRATAALFEYLRRLDAP